jgi:hypothetical protein
MRRTRPFAVDRRRSAGRPNRARVPCDDVSAIFLARSLLIGLASIHIASGVRAQVPSDREPKIDSASLTQLNLLNVRITEAVPVPAPATDVIKVAQKER